MPLSIVVVIREDPTKTHRAVEALRIALGLGTGGNPLTVILLGRAPLLLSEDTDDVVDAEILGKHLPVFKELKTPFLVEAGVPARFALDREFHVREASPEELASVITLADRVLVF